MGYVVETNNLNCAAHQKNLEFNKIDISIPDELKDFKRNEKNELVVKLKSGREVTSNLIIGCDGVNSNVKKIAKISTYGWGYSQMGIVCTV